MDISTLLHDVKIQYKHQPEFIQSVEEVLESISEYISENPTSILNNESLLRNIIIPNRIITFRVPWMDDNGIQRVQTGYRVQFNNALGPYKGGLRFHPSVNESILKFLGFEQIFKNSLTGLPLGGGKGGSDFDPKGKSDNEVLNFCKSFMAELARHIGPNTDVPAGDIGVGAREIGYLFGQYKKLRGDYEGVLTGKTFGWGGSNIRPEATGYGAVYFLEMVMNKNQDNLSGARVAVSGSGNVAQFASQKLIELGAKVVTLSDSAGTIFIEEGLNNEQLEAIMTLKNVKRGRLAELADEPWCSYHADSSPWDLKGYSVALPAATQNEIQSKHVENLLSNDLKYIVEAANMPTTKEAIESLHDKLTIVPGKAANAGGVAVSGLEMSQNSQRLTWSREKVDTMLQEIMRGIFDQCTEYGTDTHNNTDYIKGANIAGFIRVGKAMLDQGLL